MPLSSFYEIKDERLNGRECEVEREKGQIKKIIVEGKELPRKDAVKPVAGAGQKEITAKTDKKTPPPDAFCCYLPQDTKKYLPDKISNFSLFLNKMARYSPKVKAFIIPGRDGLPLKTDFPGVKFEDLVKRKEETLRKTGLLLKKEEGQTTWRLAVGLGGESVYETSLTLHHVYGFPYAPGSAVKGAVRSAIIQEIFGGSEREALMDVGFCQIFGSSAESITGSRQGLVYFFDAYPATPPRVVVEVMNPHYSPYYQDTGANFPPGDYYNPVPVFFLTVENARLGFFLGIKKEDNQRIDEGKFKGEKVLATAVSWLKKTLTTYGLGAKTSAGYGLFTLQT